MVINSKLIHGVLIHITDSETKLTEDQEREYDKKANAHSTNSFITRAGRNGTGEQTRAFNATSTNKRPFVSHPFAYSCPLLS
jgi:hypothetical protein